MHTHLQTHSHSALCSISSLSSLISHSYAVCFPCLLISFFPSHLYISLFLSPSAGFPEQTVSVAAIEFPWMRMSDRQQVHGAADASGESDYQSLLLLGAIAAASAFVVTILIVLICVGCQR